MPMLVPAGARVLAPIAMVLFAAACGGGGGGSGGSSGGATPPPQAPPPQEQSIAFDDPGPVTALVGATVVNVAGGGSGTGALSYASNDAAVATVDADSGEVTVQGPGAADITATKAADADYAAAEASYRLEAVQAAAAAAWVGANGSDHVFEDVAAGAVFARSNERACDLDNVGACSNGQSDVVDDTPIGDTTLNLTSVAYHHLASGERASQEVVASTQRFTPRIGHAVVRFAGRYWLIGGGITSGSTNVVYGDVWASDDGVTWELMQEAAAFGEQWFHQVVAFDDRLWLFGPGHAWSSGDGVQWTAQGMTPFGSVRDLNVVVFQGQLLAVHDGTAYTSADGQSWATASQPGTAGPGLDHATLNVFDDALWLIGGNDGAASSSEVWTSSDGAEWQVAADDAFPARTQHSAFVLDGRLWVFGGITEAGGDVNADAWFSSNGIDWQEAEDVDALRRVYLARAVAGEEGGIKLIGGVRIGFSNQVWQSEDGLAWEPLSPFAPFSPRYGAAAVTFDGAIWLAGGNDQLAGVSNQVWRSTDGRDWSAVIPDDDGFTPVSSHGLAAFDDRLWVVGGWDGSVAAGGTATPSNAVWSSADGRSWTRHEGAGPIFPPRLAHTLTSFAGRLWVIGGQGAGETALGDVWSSVDGETWTRETAAAAFGPRAAHAAVAFGGSLWLFGGSDGSGPFDDAWTSTDGVDWSEVDAAGASYSARLGHAMVVHDDRMWLVGGTDAIDYQSGTPINDVWWTTDAESWTRATAEAAFAPRWGHVLVSHAGALVLATGFDRTLYDDVWRSDDGAVWQVGYGTTFVVR